MQQAEIYSKLADIFHDIFEDQSIVLRPEMTAKDIKDWDSFNHINLIVATESKFGIKFKTSEVESLQSVGHFADLIQSKLAAAAR